MRRKSNSFPVYVTGIEGFQNWKRINEFHNKYKRGDYTNLADKTGYSPSHVWRVMNAERGVNLDIVRGARNMVRNRVSEFSF